MAEVVQVITPSGQPATVPAEKLGAFLARGYRVEHDDETFQRLHRERRDDENVSAFSEGFMRGFTGGLSDFASLDPERSRELRDINPYVSTTGEVAGVIAGMATPGGPVAGIGRIGKAAGAVGERAVARTGLAGGGVLARAAERAIPRGIQGVTEGTLFGAGQGFSEVALSEDPLTAEVVIATVGSRALWGGLIGGGVGTGASLLADTARGARVLARRGAARLERGAQAATDEDVVRRAVSAVEQADLENYMAVPGAPRAGAAADVAAPAAAVRKHVHGSAATRAEKAAAAAVAEDARRAAQLAAVLDDLRPEGLRAPIMVAGQAPPVAPGLPARLEVPVAALPPQPVAAEAARAAREVIRIAEGEGLRATDEALAHAARGLGLATAPAAASPAGQIFRAQVYRAAAKAKDAGVTSVVKGAAVGIAMDYVLDGALGWAAGGLLGGVAGRALRGGLAGLKPRVMAHAASALRRIDEGLDVLTRRGVPRGTLQAATVALQRAAFARDAPRDEAPSLAAMSRSREIAMAMAQRRASAETVHTSLAGLWAVEPMFGDQAEATATRGLEYLARHAPMPIAPALLRSSPWRPTALEVDAFARRVAAVEDPLRLVDELVAGRVSPETVETVREVYPAIFARMQRGVVDRLPLLRDQLDYQHRVALGALFDVPVDESQDPEMAAMIQAAFPAGAAEEAARGGITKKDIGSVPSTLRRTEKETTAQRLTGS